MTYVADLHIHSRFARACSSQLTIPNIAKYAKLKGVDLIATGDVLHPVWLGELKRDLKDLGNGVFEHQDIRFILNTEVACIYSHNGRLRRIHILIFLPSFEVVDRLSDALTKRGIKLASDGRPIMGMSSEQLCQIVFEVEPQALIVPAHIWTPWFSLFGANSGYDSLEECFGQFSDQITAIETGESSDPAMNWRIEQLDNKTIVSFSDAHSLPNIGREATIFKGDISYLGLVKDIKNQNISHTIEFFPEEGKYHYSGHRNCKVVMDPLQIKQKGKICPICQQKLTVGVSSRIEDLATRLETELDLDFAQGMIRSKKLTRPAFKKLVQLRKIIADSFGVGDQTKKVQIYHDQILAELGSEMGVLTEVKIDDIAKASHPRIAEGVQKVRIGDLTIIPGFDNTYGQIKIFEPDLKPQQVKLF